MIADYYRNDAQVIEAFSNFKWFFLKTMFSKMVSSATIFTDDLVW